MRVFEDAHHVEAEVADELEQSIVIGLGFAGEAGDEGGADRHTRNPLAEFVQQVFLLCAGDVAAHGLEHAVGDVLERNVDVLDDVGQRCDGVDHRIGEVGGIDVHEAHPAASEIACDVVERGEQRDQVVVAPRVA